MNAFLMHLFLYTRLYNIKCDLNQNVIQRLAVVQCSGWCIMTSDKAVSLSSNYHSQSMTDVIALSLLYL